MKKIFHYYSLTPEWQHDFVKQLNAEIIDNKIIIFPPEIAEGHSYFTQIMPNISVVFMNAVVKNEIKICRQPSDNDLYIFHFDLSEYTNLIKINNEDYKIGAYDKLELAIIDNQIESSFKPAINRRTIAIRILVHKKLLHDFIARNSLNENPKKKIYPGEEVFYHYGSTDSNSTLLIQSIKDMSIYDLYFESLLKGISLKLLGNFFSKFNDSDSDNNRLTHAENDSINKTKNYMLANLYGPFPSVIFLASMAGMSESKYKSAFKKCFNTTPNNFFIKEKMSLARELLRSGQYNSLTEVMYELSYSKLSYFTSKYFELFNHKPIDDLQKKSR
ncbi:helix-turn-helix domain-containing protein [Flavobacterium sp. 2]|uniref:helix-turn-helix domain-containing protein n=1 Tax=Flavobacterium sp. 2 TaxID=308053 RepID=UPI003CEF3FEF